MMSGDGPVTSKPNERMWTMEELRQTADTWSLANDAGLFLHLEQSGNTILQKSVNTRRALENIRCVIQDAHVEAQNSMNALDMLSNHKFLENLVAEETEIVPQSAQQVQEEDSAASSKLKAEEMLLLIRQALHLGLTVLDEQYERIDVLQHGVANRKRKRPSQRLANGDVSSSEEEDAEANGFAFDIDGGSFSSLEGEGLPLPQSAVEPLYQPRDPYERRQLPHLIGSEAFCQDDTLGIGYLGIEEEQVEEEEEEEEESVEDVYNPPSQGHVDFSSDEASDAYSERESDQGILRNQNQQRVPISSAILPPQRPESSVRPSKGVSMFDDEGSSDDSDIWAAARPNVVPVSQQTIPENTSQGESSSTTENRISQVPVKPQDKVNEELAKRFSTSQAPTNNNEEITSKSTVTTPQVRPVSLIPPQRVPPRNYSDSEEESDEDIFGKPLGGAPKPQMAITTASLLPKEQPKVVTSQKKYDTDEDDDDDWMDVKRNVSKPQPSQTAATLPTTATSSPSLASNNRTSTVNPQVKPAVTKQPVKSTLGGGLFSDDEDNDLFSITKKPPAKPSSQVSAPSLLPISTSSNVVAKSTTEPTSSRANALLDSSSSEGEDLFDKIISIKDKPKTSTITNQLIPKPAVKANEITKKVDDSSKASIPVKPANVPVVDTRKQPAPGMSIWSDEEEEDELFDNLMTKTKSKPQIVENTSSAKPNVVHSPIIVGGNETKANVPPTKIVISQPKVSVPTAVPTKPPLSLESSSEDDDLFSNRKTKAKPLQVPTNSAAQKVIPSPVPNIPSSQSKAIPKNDIFDDIFSETVPHVPLLPDAKTSTTFATSSDAKKSSVEAKSNPLANFEEDDLNSLFIPPASRQTVTAKNPIVQPVSSKINDPLLEETRASDVKKISDTLSTKVDVPSASSVPREKDRSDSFSTTPASGSTNPISSAPPPMGGVMVFPLPTGLTKALPDRLAPQNAFQKELEKRMQKRNSEMPPPTTSFRLSDDEEEYLVTKVKNSPRATIANPGDGSRNPEAGLDLFFSPPPSEEYPGVMRSEASSSVNLNVASTNSSGAMLNSVLISRVNMQKPTRRRPTNVRQTVSNSAANNESTKSTSNNLVTSSQSNHISEEKSSPSSDRKQVNTQSDKPTNNANAFLESKSSSGLRSTDSPQSSKPSNPLILSAANDDEDLFSSSALQKVSKPIVDIENLFPHSRSDSQKKEEFVEDIFAVAPRASSTIVLPPPVPDTKEISTVSSAPIVTEISKPPSLLSSQLLPEEEDIFRVGGKTDQSKPPESQSSTSQKTNTKPILTATNMLDEDDIFADLPPVVATKKTKKPSGSSPANVAKKTSRPIPPPLDDIDDIFDVTPKSSSAAPTSTFKSTSQPPKKSSNIQKQSATASFVSNSRNPPPLPDDDDEEDANFFDPLGAIRG